MTAPIVQLDDAAPGDRGDKLVEAMARFSVEEATSASAFDEGFDTLFRAFGPTGEIERRETLRAWFDAGSLSSPGAPIRARYHLLLARDEDGALAGVRDCFVTVDARAGRSVVLLSHTLVLPPYRRTGLAAMLRTAPAGLARRGLAEAGAPEGEVMLVAEMEMVIPKERATVVRLIAYGRAGFRVVPAEALPYAQPDFRDLDALGVEPVPLPFLALVRQVGDDARATLTKSRAASVVHHLQAVHTCHCRAQDLVPIRDHALGALERYPHDPIPLIAPPRDPSRVGELSPLLLSAVHALYPSRWWGAHVRGNPEEDLRALVAEWRPAEESPTRHDA